MNPLLKFIASVTVQTAIYWGAPKPSGYGGYTYAAAVEIPCRWDEQIELVRAANGEEVVSKAQLLLTQDVDEGGIVRLGYLADLTPAEIADPSIAEDTWKIISVSKNPLFQSDDEFVRMAYV